MAFSLRYRALIVAIVVLVTGQSSRLTASCGDWLQHAVLPGDRRGSEQADAASRFGLVPAGLIDGLRDEPQRMQGMLQIDRATAGIRTDHVAWSGRFPGVPCRGPHCGRSRSQPSAAVPPLPTQTNLRDLAVALSVEDSESTPRAAGRMSLDDLSPCQGTRSRLLRPPRAA